MIASGAGRPVARGWALAALVASVSVGVVGLVAYGASDFHGNPYATRQFLGGLTAVGVGGAIVLRGARHPVGWLLVVAGTGAWTTFAGSSVLDWMFQQPEVDLDVANVLLHLVTPGWIVTRGVFVAALPLTIPTTWRRSRLTASLWWFGWSATAVTAAMHSLATTMGTFAGEPLEGASKVAGDLLPWGHRAIWGGGVVALGTMLTAWFRSPASERRRYRSVVLATTVVLGPALANTTIEVLRLDLHLHDELELWAGAALPVVVGIGILRHGLFDLRVVVRRVTVWAVLATLGAAAYAATVAVVAALAGPDELGAIVGTGVVAVAMVPAYGRVQRWVARRVFGNRDAPGEVVRALGARLSAAPPGGQALELVAATVREQLRLPFAAIELDLDGHAVVAAVAGEPSTGLERIELRHQGLRVGSLVVGWRTEREPFGAAERALLDELAEQLGVVAHDALLTEELRRSRTVLLEAREEERRRIRRDLHDGLGPTLATVSLGLGAAAERLDDGSALATLLRDLETELRDAVADIRRLVYDLRPPALDDLGLVQAVRAHAENLEQRTVEDDRPVSFELGSSEPVADLPAAVEVAAYRVALEAMTNVIRHARAERCWIEIEPGPDLRVRIEDDGVGLDDDAVPGVGLRSMRDRVVELGGTLDIARRTPRGTRIEARFPLREVQLA